MAKSLRYKTRGISSEHELQYLSPRQSRYKGRGVLATVKNTLLSPVIYFPSCLDIFWPCISTQHLTTIFGICYKPPDVSNSILSELRSSLTYITCQFPRAALVLLGDFNYPDIYWDSLSSTNCSSSCFVKLCLHFNITQLIN